MAIYGVDIHPQYQAGISIEQIRREGFDFMAVKVSESTSSFMAAGSAAMLARGKAAGLLCLGYHYLRAGNEDAQAQLFAQELRAAGVPGMLDAEDGAGDITNIRRFLDACRHHGANVPLLYLPRWYWDRIGRPSLTGLPALWASSYVGGSGAASKLYEAITPSRWADYGGGRVEVLQFSDRGQVAGRQIDVNHYRGTRQQFAALLGGTLKPQEEPMVIELPFTGAPPDPRSDPATWPQRNFDVPVTPGRTVCFGVQDWGDRPDEARGFLYLASWSFGNGKLVPIDPAFTRDGRGRPIARHWPTAKYTVPDGALALILNYAAPAGAYVGEGPA